VHPPRQIGQCPTEVRVNNNGDSCWRLRHYRRSMPCGLTPIGRNCIVSHGAHVSSSDHRREERPKVVPKGRIRSSWREVGRGAYEGGLLRITALV
jgi:hypothetical protein